MKHNILIASTQNHITMSPLMHPFTISLGKEGYLFLN